MRRMKLLYSLVVSSATLRAAAFAPVRTHPQTLNLARCKRHAVPYALREVIHSNNGGENVFEGEHAKINFSARKLIDDRIRYWVHPSISNQTSYTQLLNDRVKPLEALASVSLLRHSH